MKEIFITGIDTDIGKTIVTGLMAAYLKNKNINAITQKIVQTGCSGISGDILVHRKLM
ncbi:MAG: AAA family ATPase, partial [Deltaproteobacteria bacterium]|nr:AAA family ATPase [Deltaproteobacteria bacterium]